MWLSSLQAWKECYAYVRPEYAAVSSGVRSMDPQHLELHKIWLKKAKGHF